jgi:hypothetical protein
MTSFEGDTMGIDPQKKLLCKCEQGVGVGTPLLVDI